MRPRLAPPPSPSNLPIVVLLQQRMQRRHQLALPVVRVLLAPALSRPLALPPLPLLALPRCLHRALRRAAGGHELGQHPLEVLAGQGGDIIRGVRPPGSAHPLQQAGRQAGRQQAGMEQRATG